MAKKSIATTSIDLVVNTAGVQQAISRVNGMMRGIGGRGGGGGGPDGGRFSAGITPVGYAFGGGGAGGAAAAAAFGAALGSGSRAFQEFKARSAMGMAPSISARAGIIGTGRSSSRNSLYNQMRRDFSSVHSAELFDMMDPLRGGDPDALNVFTEAQSRIGRTVQHRQRVMERAKRIARSRYRLQSQQFDPTRFGQMMGMGRLAGMGLGAIGLGGGAVGGAMALNNFDQRMAGIFSDRTQFLGTPHFAASQAMRQQYSYGSRSMTFGQGLMLGNRYKNPTQKGLLETAFGGIQDIMGRYGYGIGALASDGLGAIGEMLTPGSQLRQNLGEDPNNLGALRRGQREFMRNWSSSTQILQNAYQAIKLAL